MTILKKQYYLYIENTNDIDLKKINKRYKFTIIYRNKKANEVYISSEKLEVFLNRSQIVVPPTRKITYNPANDL